MKKIYYVDGFIGLDSPDQSFLDPTTVRIIFRKEEPLNMLSFSVKNGDDESIQIHISAHDMKKILTEDEL